MLSQKKKNLQSEFLKLNIRVFNTPSRAKYK